MSKSTIFGRDNFIDKAMIEIIQQEEKYIFDEVYKEATMLSKTFVKVDRKKLEEWLRFCAQLEQIDKSELTELAIKKKFADLNQDIEDYKRALELASEERDDWGGKSCGDEGYFQYFLNQDRKKMENRKSFRERFTSEYARETLIEEYDEMQKEIDQLKSSQNKTAVDKLKKTREMG